MHTNLEVMQCRASRRRRARPRRSPSLSSGLSRPLTGNFVSFQRRNAEVARGWTEFLKLQESNARAAQDLFTSVMRFAELQQRNVRFVQEWMDYGVNFWRDQAESNAGAAEVVAQSASEQQEKRPRARPAVGLGLREFLLFLGLLRRRRAQERPAVHRAGARKRRTNGPSGAKGGRGGRRADRTGGAGRRTPTSCR